MSEIPTHDTNLVVYSEEQRQRLAEAEEAERRRLYRLAWLDARVPAEFEKAQPDYLRPFLDMPAVRLVRETIRTWRDARTQPDKIDPKPLLIGICGSPGTGKTTVGVELLRLAAQNYASVRYFTLDRFLRVVDSHAMPWEDIELEFFNPKMVVVDDVFFQNLPSHRAAFNQLVVDRCSALRWTVVVSTVDPKEFGNVLGAQAVDRFSAPALPLVGQSHRSYS